MHTVALLSVVVLVVRFDNGESRLIDVKCPSEKRNRTVPAYYDSDKRETLYCAHTDDPNIMGYKMVLHIVSFDIEGHCDADACAANQTVANNSHLLKRCPECDVHFDQPPYLVFDGKQIGCDKSGNVTGAGHVEIDQSEAETLRIVFEPLSIHRNAQDHNSKSFKPHYGKCITEQQLTLFACPSFQVRRTPDDRKSCVGGPQIEGELRHLLYGNYEFGFGSVYDWEDGGGARRVIWEGRKLRPTSRVHRYEFLDFPREDCFEACETIKIAFLLDLAFILKNDGIPPESLPKPDASWEYLHPASTGGNESTTVKPRPYITNGQH